MKTLSMVDGEIERPDTHPKCPRRVGRWRVVYRQHVVKPGKASYWNYFAADERCPICDQWYAPRITGLRRTLTCSPACGQLLSARQTCGKRYAKVIAHIPTPGELAKIKRDLRVKHGLPADPQRCAVCHDWFTPDALADGVCEHCNAILAT